MPELKGHLKDLCGDVSIIKVMEDQSFVERIRFDMNIKVQNLILVPTNGQQLQYNGSVLSKPDYRVRPLSAQICNYISVVAQNFIQSSLQHLQNSSFDVLIG